MARVVEKYGVSRFVKTSHKVVKCSWDESAKKWYVFQTDPFAVTLDNYTFIPAGRLKRVNC